jgi:hypothetical protein
MENQPATYSPELVLPESETKVRVTYPAIFKAVRSLMETVTNVEKGGAITSGSRQYTFRKVDDLVQHVGDAARQQGVMLQSEITDCQYSENTVSDRNGNLTLWTSCRLRIKYIFTSLEDGSNLTFEAVGEGRDNSDKATSKAMSMALKYALGQALLIPSGDADPDQERPEVTHVRPANQNRDPEEALNKAIQAAGEAKSIAELEKIRAHAEKINIIDRSYMGLTLRQRIENLIKATEERIRLDAEKQAASGEPVTEGATSHEAN